jgi:hypothetical protein
MPTVAVGTDLPVPMSFLHRQLACWPSRNMPSIDGPDNLPSAQDMAVGTVARSHSEGCDLVSREKERGCDLVLREKERGDADRGDPSIKRRHGRVIRLPPARHY